MKELIEGIILDSSVVPDTVGIFAGVENINNTLVWLVRALSTADQRHFNYGYHDESDLLEYWDIV